MRKKNELKPDEMAKHANQYFLKNFKNYSAAATYFETSPGCVCNIIKGRQPPSQDMLIAMGYVKETVYRRVK